MVGCTLGVVLSSGLINDNAKRILREILRVMSIFSMIGILAFAILSDWRNPWMLCFGYFIVELLTAVLILDILINPQSIIKKILAMRWLVWVGSISYGLYLWHYPLYRTLIAMGFYDLAILITLGSTATFIIAALSYYVMEKPILKFQRRFARVTLYERPSHF